MFVFVFVCWVVERTGGYGVGAVRLWERVVETRGAADRDTHELVRLESGNDIFW